MAVFHALVPSPNQWSGIFRSMHKIVRKAPFLAGLMLAALLLASCAPATPAAPAPTATAQPAATAAPISLVDGNGRTVTLAKPAQRVISLAPSDTEILYAIGAGAQLLGVDQYSDYPPEAKKLTVVGSGVDKPDTELILSLKPDLVLAAGVVPADKVKALEDVGLTVFTVPNPTDLDGMYATLRTVAQLTGHAAETEALIASLKARVKAVEDKVAGAKSQPLVLYELDATDPNAPWTSGPGTFMDNLIRMAGGRNVGSGLKSDWAQISTEEVIRQNPDIILLGDFTLGGVTADMVRARSGWGGMAAVKNNQVYPIDDNIVSRPGPRLVEGLEAAAKLLHPELFK
jgi:iron complex transport system substrate-binding protein